MKLELTKKESQVVKQLMGIQIASCNSILEGTCEEDITLYRLENDIEHEALRLCVTRNLIEYTKVYNEPNLLLNLDWDELSVVKHLLHSFLNKRRHIKAKRSIWRKLLWFESLKLNLN